MRQGFVAACEDALAAGKSGSGWQAEVDRRLAGLSWDATQASMAALVDAAVAQKARGGFRTVSRSGGAAGASRRPMTCWWRAPASPDRCWPSGWRRGPASGCWSATGARTSAATPTTRSTRPGSWSTATGRTSSTPIRTRSSPICRASPSGGRYEHRVLADLGDRRLPMPINRTTLNVLYGRPLPDEAAAERLPGRARRAGGRGPHPRGRGGLRGRAASSTRRSSRATPASSGGSTRPSSTSR